MKRSTIAFIVILLSAITTTTAQKVKQRIITDSDRKFVYTDTGGVTQSYTGYFGSNFTYPTLKTINGEVLNAEFFKGKTVVMNFWFVACKPCVEEMPALNRIYDKYRSDSVVFVAITFDDEAKIKNFLQSNHFSFSIASLTQQEIAKYKQVMFYPLTLIMDEQTTIRFALFGRPGGKKNMEELYELLDARMQSVLHN